MKRTRTTRAERRVVRQRVGPLTSKLVSRKTAILYQQSLALFYWWLRALRLPWPETSDGFDQLVALWIGDSWMAGETKATVNHFISAVFTFERPLHSALIVSRQLVAVWAKQEPAQRAFPLTWRQVRTLAGLAVCWSLPGMALALLVGHLGLLRIAELLALLKGDVCIQGASVTLTLRSTKTGKRFNTLEFASFNSAPVAAWLSLHLRSLQPDAPVFFQAHTLNSGHCWPSFAVQCNLMWSSSPHTRSGEAAQRNCSDIRKVLTPWQTQAAGTRSALADCTLRLQ
jgi:hypothetical protein